jgi:hypothetical protein
MNGYVQHIEPQACVGNSSAVLKLRYVKTTSVKMARGSTVP